MSLDVERAKTSNGHAVIDTGLGARFLGHGAPIEPLVGRLADGLASAGVPAGELAAVVFTHLHQDHCRGATWSGEPTFPRATGFAHAAEVAFWSGAQAAGVTGQEHIASAQSDGERLLCAGDLFYDQLQLSHPQWCTPWDHDTVRAVHARRRLLDRAADEHLLIHAYHMPFPGLGAIARHGGGYRWQPLQHE